MIMSDLLLVLFPVLLFGAAGYKARISKKGSFSRTFMLPDQTKMIQAAACLGIILHHVTQQITEYGVLPRGPIGIFNETGFLLTALFFFYSGYGLITSFYTKPFYLHSFLQNRLPRVLIPFWVINLLGCLADRFVYGVRLGPEAFLARVFGLFLGNSNSWFIIEITVLYLFFYLFFFLVPEKDLALLLLEISVLCLIVFAFFRGHDPLGAKGTWFRGEWWYNSTAAFAAGTLYGRFRDRADPFLRKNYRVCLGLSALLTAGSVHLAVFMVRRWGYYHEGSFYGYRGALLTLLSQSAACCCFVFFLLLVSMKISLGNPLIRYLAGIRAELFLIHGYFVNRVFAPIRMPDFVRFGAVIVCSILCTALLAPGIRILTRRAAEILMPRQAESPTLEREMAERRRRKVLKRIAAAVGTGILVLGLVLLWRAPGHLFFAGKECREEYEALSGAGIGDEVFFGYFEMEPARLGKERIPWIVARRWKDQVILVSRYGIAGSFYHQRHEAVSWEESDLRTFLNSETFLSAFSSYERAYLADTDGDAVTLLTAEEAESFFEKDTDRELAITKAAEQEGTNINRMSKHHGWDMKGYRSSWWWLRGEKGEKSLTAPIVTVDGEILRADKAVNKPGGALRPVIRIRLTQKQTTSERGE